MSMTLDGTLGVTFPDSLVIPPTNTRSMVQLNTANGYGSTNTAIRRFTNVVANQGSDITYADSATNGASFTINTNGVYAISYDDQFSSAGFFGISINSNQLTTSISTITVANILAIGTAPAANQPDCVGTTLYIAAGAVIRAHTNSVSSGSVVNGCQFTITRID